MNRDASLRDTFELGESLVSPSRRLRREANASRILERFR